MKDPAWTSTPNMAMGAPMMQMPQMPMAMFPQTTMGSQMNQQVSPITRQKSDPPVHIDTPIPSGNLRTNL